MAFYIPKLKCYSHILHMHYNRLFLHSSHVTLCYFVVFEFSYVFERNGWNLDIFHHTKVIGTRKESSNLLSFTPIRGYTVNCKRKSVKLVAKAHLFT